MLRAFPLPLLAALACAPALANAEAVTYAIDNPLRPGAKAAHCTAQPETADGCTFHSVGGDSYSARLPVSEGQHWVARTADNTEVRFEAVAGTLQADGQSYQQIKLLPDPARNADASVTFDKLTGKPGALKVIERRRINVMIHPS